MLEFFIRIEVVAVISCTSAPAAEFVTQLRNVNGANWEVLKWGKFTKGPMAFAVSIIGTSNDAISGGR
jgi:hypothetical protein